MESELDKATRLLKFFASDDGIAYLADRDKVSDDDIDRIEFALQQAESSENFQILKRICASG